MEDSFFSERNLKTRFLCIFGNVNDLYVDELLYPLPIYQALHRDLKKHGYERVILYRYGSGVYFFDRDSMKLWHGNNAEPPLSPDSLFKGKILKGSLIESQLDEQSPLSYTLSGSEFLRSAETLIKQSEIPTAILFPDGVAALREFHNEEYGRLLENFFFSLTAPDAKEVGNRNCLIFLFNGSSDHVEKEFSHDLRALYIRYLCDPASSFHHYVGPPNHCEIRNLLNFLRLYGHCGKRLSIDCRGLSAMSGAIASRVWKNSVADAESRRIPGAFQPFDLKGVMSELIRCFVNTNKTLDESACMDLCGTRNRESAWDKLNRMVGMKKLKDTLKTFLQKNRVTEDDMEKPAFRLSPPIPEARKNSVNFHIILTGNSGTGKTSVARCLGEIFAEYGLLPSGHTVETIPGHLIGTHIGESEENFRKEREKAMGGTLFIDEAYGLATENAYTQGIITQIISDTELYRGMYSMILAGYPEEMEALLGKNQGFKSRFPIRLHIDDYTGSELAEIFLQMARDGNLTVSEELKAVLPDFFERWRYDKQAKTSQWQNAREVRNLIERMRSSSGGELSLKDIPDSLRPYADDRLETDARRRLDEMEGLKSVKKEIRKLLRRAKFQMEPLPLHYIFAGNPGTGKTTVAQLMGRLLKEYGAISRYFVITCRPDDFISQYRGETAQKARKQFERAINGVLFIDEAYQLLPSADRDRSAGRENDFEGAVMNLLLEYTDPDNKKPLCVICAGYEEDMERFRQYNKGLERRFITLHFEPYNEEELTRMLEAELQRRQYDADAEYLSASKAHFKKYLNRIQREFNGGYILRYLGASVDLLLEKLDKEAENESILVKRRIALTKDDAPETFV